VPKGDVVVAGIPVGLNYFTSIGPAHCDADDVRIIINVLPGRMRLWVTLWSAPGQTTTAPIHMALTGYRANDPTGKVWTSPERQLNQRATDYDFFKYVVYTCTRAGPAASAGGCWSSVAGVGAAPPSSAAACLHAAAVQTSMYTRVCTRRGQLPGLAAQHLCAVECAVLEAP